MRNAFINKLEALSGSDKNIYLLTGDLGFRLFDNYRKINPTRFFNMGIAEPNMIGVAAGLALSGKKVYCYSMVPFLVMRCFEQIRIDICYNKLDVTLIGVGGGLTYGVEGVTHHAIEDLALMRALPNMTVAAPGDPFEAAGCIEASARHNGPLFIRLGKNNEPQVHKKAPKDFRLGRGLEVLNTGSDVCIFATGSMLYNAKKAAELLVKNDIGVNLVSMHTVKPLDEALVNEKARRYRCIVSVEEHSVIGGLGSAISEVLSESGYRGLFKRIGLPDRFNDSAGKTDYLHERYGLCPEKISRTIVKLAKKV